MLNKANETRTEYAYNYIRTAIYQNIYPPGMRLLEDDIVKKTGVSRISVRSAMVKLSAEGLVEIIPQRGALIPNLTVKDLKEIMDIRKAIESLVVREIAEKITCDDLAKLDNYIQLMKSACLTGAFRDFSKASDEFHSLMINIYGNKRVKTILDNYYVATIRWNFYGLLEPGRAKNSINEHKEIVKALKKHDSTAAEKAMESHIESIYQGWEKSLKSNT